MMGGPSGGGVGLSGVNAGRDVNVVVANHVRTPLLVLTFASGAALVLFPEVITLVLGLVVLCAALVVLPRAAAAAQSAKVTTGSFPVFKSALVGTTTLTLGAAGAGGASAAATVYVTSEGRSFYSLDSVQEGARDRQRLPPQTTVSATATMTVDVVGRQLQGSVVGLRIPEEYGVLLYGVTDSYNYVGTVPVLRDGGNPARGIWSATAPLEANQMLAHVIPRSVEIKNVQGLVNHRTPPGTVLTQLVRLEK